MPLTEAEITEVKRLIVEEVAKQISPLHDWMLSFWSNGSQRPPGYFQMRVKADDERYDHLDKKTDAQSVILEKIDFFVKTSQERQLRRDKYIKFWLPVAKWVLGCLGTAILGILLWAYHAMQPVVKILWEDYLKAHPVVMERMKNLSTDDEPALSSSQPQLDSRAPMR